MVGNFLRLRASVKKLYTSLLPGRRGTKHKCLLSLLIFHTVLEGLPRARMGRPGKSKKMGKEEIKLLLFADYVIVYLEYSSDSKQV